MCVCVHARACARERAGGRVCVSLFETEINVDINFLPLANCLNAHTRLPSFFLVLIFYSHVIRRIT